MERHHRRRNSFEVQLLRLSGFQRRLCLRPGSDGQQYWGIGQTSATQYYAVVNTGNGTSTPPFSNEQPSGFSAADKAGFYHNTFDPFYRDHEGAVPESTQVTLRFRTLHSSGIWGLTARAYLFDTASGTTTGPVDTSMPFDQNITINGTEYDVWKTR